MLQGLLQAGFQLGGRRSSKHRGHNGMGAVLDPNIEVPEGEDLQSVPVLRAAGIAEVVLNVHQQPGFGAALVKQQSSVAIDQKHLLDAV